MEPFYLLPTDGSPGGDQGSPVVAGHGAGSSSSVGGRR